MRKTKKLWTKFLKEALQYNCKLPDETTTRLFMAARPLGTPNCSTFYLRKQISIIFSDSKKNLKLMKKDSKSE